ncbi:MAG: hypothetical protein U0Q16_39505 [Bryobacteraceae bacterium]
MTGYTMLKDRKHYREQSAAYLDTLNKEQVTNACLRKLAQLGIEVIIKDKDKSS